MAGRPKGTKQKRVDREKLWELHLQGLNGVQIAEILGCHPKTAQELVAERISIEQAKKVYK